MACASHTTYQALGSCLNPMPVIPHQYWITRVVRSRVGLGLVSETPSHACARCGGWLEACPAHPQAGNAARNRWHSPSSKVADTCMDKERPMAISDSSFSGSCTWWFGVKRRQAEVVLRCVGLTSASRNGTLDAQGCFGPLGTFCR